MFELSDSLYERLQFSGVGAIDWHSMSDERRAQFMREKRKLEAFKTELCKGFIRTGFCRYGAQCRFAHSNEELRIRPMHPKYKTELCLNFSVKGQCGYGSRCQFIHRSPESRRRNRSNSIGNGACTPTQLQRCLAGSHGTTPLLQPHFHIPHLHEQQLRQNYINQTAAVNNAVVETPSSFAISAYTSRDIRRRPLVIENTQLLPAITEQSMQGSLDDGLERTETPSSTWMNLNSNGSGGVGSFASNGGFDIDFVRWNPFSMNSFEKCVSDQFNSSSSNSANKMELPKRCGK